MFHMSQKKLTLGSMIGKISVTAQISNTKRISNRLLLPTLKLYSAFESNSGSRSFQRSHGVIILFLLIAMSEMK